MRRTSTWMLVLFAAALFAALPAAADAPAAVAAPPAADAAADCAAPSDAAGDAEPLFLAGEICGSKICGKGTYCCNASCSLCVQFGMSCTQQVCFAPAQAIEGDGREPVQIIGGGGQCNQTVCGADQFCCNHSCSTCAPRGGACTQQICPPTS